MDGGGLEWRAEERGDVRVLAPSGRVDEATANEFNERLGEAAASGGTLVLDLGGIGYMSSRGLRALTLAQRRGSEAGTTIVLARPNETMREILAISRYDMIFRVTDTIEDALDG
jgi:anti-anti-sigma factor